MYKTYNNVCVRCGKPRVVEKTWKEKVGYSMVTTVDMICPDTDCQKKVDQNIEKQRSKLAAMRLKSNSRGRKTNNLY